MKKTFALNLAVSLFKNEASDILEDILDNKDEKKAAVRKPIELAQLIIKRYKDSD